jgi:sporulation protein YlmC with PRC-barrel domain
MDTMFIKLASTTAITTALVAFLATAATAQTSEAVTADDPRAAACLTAMNEFAARLNEDEFWLSGMSTGGYGAPPAPQSTQAPATVPPAGGNMTTTGPEAGLSPEVDPDMAARSQMEGIDAPRYQVRSLYSAARVLAHRGDDEGCGLLVAEMNEVYDDYSQQMQDAGVDPATVTTWRQEQLALAHPLAESEGMSSYRIDDITGTNVRNVQDESLGSVSDVIIDPQSGQAAYVIVARGGFLGIGEDYYAVPWDEVRATPGLDTIVLDHSEADLEQAPSIDPDRFRDFETMGEERRSTDQFWTERG